MKIYSKTDKGKVRETNQDSFVAAQLNENAAFAIVCDGMGGAKAGNVASETAAKTISDYIIHSYRKDMDEIETEKMLKSAIESANILIYDLALKNSELHGMGTTAVVVVAENDRAVIANVGDSRAYHKGKKLKQITRDHSVVQNLIESGKITAQDAKYHPRKNVITRALGAEENIITDISVIKLQQGDTLLLCTDGLSSFADSKDILKVLEKENAENVPESLISIANSNGGGDNITAVTLVW